MEVGPQSISGALVTGAGRTIGRGVQIASSPYCNTHAKIHSSDCPASQLRRGGGFPWRFRTLRLAIQLSQVEHKILSWAMCSLSTLQTQCLVVGHLRGTGKEYSGPIAI